MIKIRTITTRGTTQDIKSSQFDILPSFEDLETHFLKQVPWRNIIIKFDDELSDDIHVVDSDESLMGYCEGKMLLSFFVGPLKGRIYQEEIKRLVGEGFPRGKCRGLLMKFKGDVELVRNAFKEMGDSESEEVRVLSQEGIPRKMAIRLFKRFGDLNLVREHYLKNIDMDNLYSGIADRLFDEGYKQKRRSIRLLSKFNGDVDKVKQIMDQKKRKREKIPKEHHSYDRKEKKEMKKKRLCETVDMDFMTHPDGYSITIDSSPDYFVDKIGRVYLDGNNMLYIEKEMRNLSIKGRNKIQAEKMLGNIALYFTQAMNLRRDFQMNLMFDTSSLHGTTDMNFEIISGKAMGFNTADDALVSLSQEFPSELLSDTLFVTSDVELQKRLTENGAFIMKPKEFLKYAKVLIGEETYQAILQKETSLF